MRRLLAIGSLLVLAGCGKEVDLKPTPGMTLVKPATAPAVASVDKMMTPGPEQRPARTDEPLTRSLPRGDDKFDLPPPG